MGSAAESIEKYHHRNVRILAQKWPQSRFFESRPTAESADVSACFANQMPLTTALDATNGKRGSVGVYWLNSDAHQYAPHNPPRACCAPLQVEGMARGELPVLARARYKVHSLSAGTGTRACHFLS